VTDLTYAMPLPGKLITHGDGYALLLRDGYESDKEELLAHARSGDYLATLATQLDSISDALTKENEAEAAILQQIVDNLIYLDEKNYKLTKK
jgi:hypothetical protein